MNFYRVPGHGWTIELLLEEGESPEDVENTDGWVIVHGEGRWAFTLLTVAELNRLMARWQQTGEYLGGAYFSCPDLVLPARRRSHHLPRPAERVPRPGKRHRLTVEGTVELTDGPLGRIPAQIEDLLDTTVRSAVAFKSGPVRLVFSSGHFLITRETPAPPLLVTGLAGANHLFDDGTHTTAPTEPVPEG